jgi:hypothetical protein
MSLFLIFYTVVTVIQVFISYKQLTDINLETVSMEEIHFDY